jgi:hypothetical protein
MHYCTKVNSELTKVGNIANHVQRAYNGLLHLADEWQQVGAAVNASNHDLLYFIQADLVACPVVELRRPRGFMGGDLLGMFQSPTVEQIFRDSRGPERVAANIGRQPRGSRPTFDHGQDFPPADPSLAQPPVPIQAAEQRRLRAAAHPRRKQVGVHVILGLVMRRYIMGLAALLVQPERIALAPVDRSRRHPWRRPPDAGEAEHHHLEPLSVGRNESKSSQ